MRYIYSLPPTLHTLSRNPMLQIVPPGPTTTPTRPSCACFSPAPLLRSKLSSPSLDTVVLLENVGVINPSISPLSIRCFPFRTTCDHDRDGMRLEIACQSQPLVIPSFSVCSSDFFQKPVCLSGFSSSRMSANPLFFTAVIRIRGIGCDGAGGSS